MSDEQQEQSTHAPFEHFPSLYDDSEAEDSATTSEQPPIGAISAKERELQERFAQAKADIEAGKPIQKKDESTFSRPMSRMR